MLIQLKINGANDCSGFHQKVRVFTKNQISVSKKFKLWVYEISTDKFCFLQKIFIEYLIVFGRNHVAWHWRCPILVPRVNILKHQCRLEYNALIYKTLVQHSHQPEVCSLNISSQKEWSDVCWKIETGFISGKSYQALRKCVYSCLCQDIKILRICLQTTGQIFDKDEKDCIFEFLAVYKSLSVVFFIVLTSNVWKTLLKLV